MRIAEFTAMWRKFTISVRISVTVISCLTCRFCMQSAKLDREALDICSNCLGN
jgi:hypothetical protein